MFNAIATSFETRKFLFKTLRIVQVLYNRSVFSIQYQVFVFSFFC